ncbi:flagellar filament capping protein FliD [Trinickia soli]|uniref:Flagellar hook-associated protein 2 n=1 Tax=Trinickia soli TaxID=380675 RepID=A0A2N7VU00_9BURK|nr:flagellar filament capping protein FliD [Trinickia soli]PMS20627.1 flagellar hook protein FliD [Trinickia soli]CAB3697536.1 B-type flagellar hook-associated protein 2 [Trinickia soli]
MSTVSSSSTSSVLQQAAQSILSGVTNSQLDVNTLVSALVTGATAAQASTIAVAANSDNTQLSALGSMQSSMSNLLNSLGGLADGSIFTKLSASMSGTGITATTSTGAAAGTYSVSVQQIATANQISSKAYASNATLGTGNLNIGVGTGTMTIALTSSNNTLSGIASAINSATNNPGVTAAVVTGTDGQHLVLTSTQTGSANTVSVSADPTVDAGMATANFTQVTAAQDAKLTVSGTSVVSASNNVTTAMSGVTLSLTSASVGTSQTLSVATNTSSISTALQNFTTAYNSWISTVKSLSSYDSTSHAAGPLLGDAMLNSAVNGIASIMASGVTVGGTTYSLAQLGVNLNDDGTLAPLDATTLQSTLASSPSMASNVFNGTNGIGEQLSSFISSYTTAVTGQIAQRNSTLQSDLTAQQQAETNLVAYQAALTSQYQAEFTQLNTIMSQTQNNTTYLNQLFGGNGSAGTINKK